MSLGEVNYMKFAGMVQRELANELPGFRAQQKMAPSIREGYNGISLPKAQARQSAVLVLLFIANRKVCTLFIKRTVYNGPHSGQVSFPGGKAKGSDASIQQTALREAQEEVGVNSSDVILIGDLTPLHIPVSNMMVNPVVGYAIKSPTFYLNLQEVEYSIVAPLDDLLNPSNRCVKVISPRGIPVTAPYYNIANEMIWGATAMILSEFLEIIQRIRL